ncbi:hypothetical protein [Amycolatopsis saalfeldensis]|uniref:hypothetical protein n=1 Tax=Amycolatopsis saalfeldensis TaxID=394193 RepID=UPI001FE9906F|nr:hypothetical protein [Amycolatopsis saalfeldensis]
MGALAAGGFGAFLAGAIVDGGWRQLAFACSASIAVLLIAGLVQLGVPAHTGGGDTALYGAIAMYLGWFGWEGLLRGLLVASGLTAAVALVVVMRSGHTNVRFPAGPSLLAGAAISILFA